MALVGCPWCAWGDHGAICVAWTVEFDAPTLRWRVHGALPGRWSLSYVGSPPTWVPDGEGDLRQQFNDSQRGVGAAVTQWNTAEHKQITESESEYIAAPGREFGLVAGPAAPIC